MEDIQAYIQSGVLELYAMGDLSPAERLQVEEMVAKSLEVKTELNDIEAAMEKYARAQAITPLKTKLRDINNVLTKH